MNFPNIFPYLFKVCFSLIALMKLTQETFQNNSVLNFTQEININNKITFLGILIDTSNIDRFITSTYKKSTNINP